MLPCAAQGRPGPTLPHRPCLIAPPKELDRITSSISPSLRSACRGRRMGAGTDDPPPPALSSAISGEHRCACSLSAAREIGRGGLRGESLSRLPGRPIFGRQRPGRKYWHRPCSSSGEPTTSDLEPNVARPLQPPPGEKEPRRRTRGPAICFRGAGGARTKWAWATPGFGSKRHLD